MTRIMLWAVDRPWLAGALIAAVTVALGFQMVGLEIDTSTESFIVEKDPARQYYEGFKQKFGGDTRTIVLVKAADAFTPSALAAIRRLSDSLADLDGVTRVESLTTVRDFRGAGDSLTTDPLVGAAIPSTPGELARVRARAIAMPAFVGTLVSRDGRAAAIIAHSTAAAGDRAFSRRFSDHVEALIRRESAPELTIYQIGGPFADAIAGRLILSDLATFVPISLVIAFAFFFLAFRTLQGVVIPVVTGGLSIVWTLGLMAVAGLPINILTAAVPSLLMVIGSTEDVHMLAEYHHLLEEGLPRDVAIRTMVRQAALPILVTTATTVFGFLSLATSDITMLIQFGYVAAMGLTANFAVTVIALPIFLVLWPSRARRRVTAFEDPRVHGVIPPLMERLAAVNLRHRVLITVVAGGFAVACLVGWTKLRVDTDALSFFAEGTLLRQRVADFQASMGGPVGFAIVVEARRPDGVPEPDVLRGIVALQAFVEAQPGVDKTVSVADYMRKMHRELHGGDATFDRVPDSREQAAQYLVLLEGKELDKLLDFDASTASILVRHHITGSAALGDLLARIDEWVRGHFPPGLVVRHTGDAILVRNAADYMAINEVTSFGSTILIIGLIHAWLFRSIRAGFLSLVPDVIPVLFAFGLMGLLGIPLNPGTAMIVSIALGIAVDDTVHHIVTYRRELRQRGDRRAAMVHTMRAQGRPIVYVSVALAAGFAVLGLSNFVPIADFGVLSAIVMLVAMVAELTLTPILMYWAANWHGTWSPFARFRRSADAES